MPVMAAMAALCCVVTIGAKSDLVKITTPGFGHVVSELRYPIRGCASIRDVKSVPIFNLAIEIDGHRTIENREIFISGQCPALSFYGVNIARVEHSPGFHLGSGNFCFVRDEFSQKGEFF